MEKNGNDKKKVNNSPEVKPADKSTVPNMSDSKVADKEKTKNVTDMYSGLLAQMLQENGVTFTSEGEKKDLMSFALTKLFDDYKTYCMDKEKICQTKIAELKLQNQLRNATAKEEYSASFTIPEGIVDDFEVDIKQEFVKGLTGIKEGLTYTISGTPVLDDPKSPQEVELVIRYKYVGWVEGKPILSTTLRFAVNANSRDLWNNNPTPEDIEYFKPDQDCDYVKVEEKNGVPQKDIVAASVRGRSHAHENPGKPRDDDFKVSYCEDTGWYVMAVADGAGSAKFSREGSKIACETVQGFCKECLTNTEEFEASIAKYYEENSKENNDDSIMAARKAVGDKIYGILGTAAVRAHKAINEEVEKYNNGLSERARMNTSNSGIKDSVIPSQKAVSKDFATTLLLTICKKFDFGWFVASWWVGDGAIGLYEEGKGIKILGEPDEGEFGGQTRFLTMREIFTDATAFYKRLRFVIVPDFTALLLMTDGVSDAKFETDANLASLEKWDELWRDIAGENEEKCKVDLSDDNEESKYQLMQWLNFYTKSNHDDRTIAILY